MNDVITLAEADINWSTVIVGVCLIILALIGLLKVKDYFFDRFGIETRASLEKKRFKNEIDELRKKIDENEQIDIEYRKLQDAQLQIITDTLGVINKKLDKQSESEFKKLRHSIVRAGEEFLDNGVVTIRSWKSIHELYEEYKNEYKGNGYVQSLMEKVDQLPVIGQLDEHGNDV